jgi:cytochrome c oxidase subunit 4
MTLAQYRKIEPGEEGPHEPGGHAHPSAAEYLRIGLILGAITAVEVAIYYVGLSQTLLVVFLLTFSAIKFSLVVLWFMHLRFDNRIFSQLFVGGFLLAMSVFTVAMATLGAKLV